MGFSDNVRTDVRLKNLTIYAQWLSMTAAMLLYLVGLPLLITYLIQLSSVLNSNLVLFEYVGHAVLFPLASLALDLPHYLPRTLFLCLSMISWVGFTGYSIFTNMRNLSLEHGFRDFIKAVVLMFTTFIAMSAIWTTYLAKAHIGTRVRFCINALYCAHLGIAWFNPISYYGIGLYVRNFYLGVAGLFGVAALLCSVAWAKRHQWVSSMTLGGTAIEPMVLTVPGGGPRYQSVGDEARDGAIRLV